MQTLLGHFRKRVRALFIPVSVFIAGMIASFYFSAGEIYDYTDTLDGAHLPAVDAIVVLTGGKGRVSAAADLWFRYWEQTNQSEKMPVLYVAGAGRNTKVDDITRQMRRGVANAIKPGQIYLEQDSSNTFENAEFFANYAAKVKWKRVILVTSSYHMKRSDFLFKRSTSSLGIGIETYSFVAEPFYAKEWMFDFRGIEVTIEEYIKMLIQRLMFRT